MPYDRKRRTSYHFATVDHGAGSNETRVIAVPLDAGSVGKRGRVAGLTVHNVTEDYVGTSTAAGTQVGTGAADGTYYDSGLVLAPASPAIGGSEYHLDSGSAIDIPAGRTAVTVTFVVSTGGSEAGKADVTLDIDWDN